MRCERCRLIVGAERGVDEAGDTPSSVTVSAAAILSNTARRANVAAVDRDLVLTAIATCATDEGRTIRTLRLVDYERCWAANQEWPSVAQVLATFGDWKSARAAAWERHRMARADEVAGP